MKAVDPKLKAFTYKLRFCLICQKLFRRICGKMKKLWNEKSFHKEIIKHSSYKSDIESKQKRRKAQSVF